MKSSEEVMQVKKYQRLANEEVGVLAFARHPAPVSFALCVSIPYYHLLNSLKFKRSGLHFSHREVQICILLSIQSVFLISTP